MRLPSRLVFALLLMLPSVARAQGIDDTSARSIQHALHDWIARLAGPEVDPALLTPQVTAAGDHYAVRLPMPGLVGEGAATARLLPLGPDRWSLQAIELPPVMHFNLHVAEPGVPAHAMAVAVSVTIGSQDSQALIDPTLRSRSALHVELHNLTVRSIGPRQTAQQHMGEYQLHATLQPDPAGGLEFGQAATVTGWSSTSQRRGKPALSLGADRIAMNGHIGGLNPDQAGALLSAVSGFVATLPPKALVQGGPAPLGPAQRTALRRLVESLRGIVISMHAEETIDGLHFTLAGLGDGTARQVHFAFGGSAPDGLLHGWMEIAAEGISIPTLPPGLAGLMPHHVVLRPSVTGVSANAVMQMLLDATQPDANQAELEDEAATLLRPGSTLAVDRLGFDVGPAAVQGTGHVTVVGPDAYDGAAHLVATGFDSLLQRAQRDPSLLRTLPILIMLRGYAKQEGNRLVWNVVAQGGGVTINGMPLIQPNAADAGQDQPPPDNHR